MALSNFTKAKIFGGEFSFTARPEPVAGDLRMAWGISILIASLSYSRGKKASFPKLQLLAHSVRLPEGRDDIDWLLAGTLTSREVSMRVEPWLNRAVSFAYAMGLVSVDRGKSVALTAKGLQVSEQLKAKAEIMPAEQAFLRRVTPRLTDKIVEKIWRMETLL